MSFTITHIDTACCLIQIDGFTILTDPVFDAPGKYYHHGYGSISKKYSTPAISPESLPNIDLILLSHPQHKDNFDNSGKKIAEKVPRIISTPKIKKKFNNGIGLKPWESHVIQLSNGSELKITATPAQHHPWWLPKFLSGDVIGFVIEHNTSGKVFYITGDTVFFKGIKKVAETFPQIDISIIHVGGVQFRYLVGFGKFTMNKKGFVKTLQSINPKVAIPIHNSGWTHFKENDSTLRKELQKHNEIIEQVHFLESGKEYSFN